jgi:hypothetical protein
VKIRIEGGLLYITAELIYQGQKLILQDVILDTGSAATLFSVDESIKLGLVPEPGDPIRRVRGVGGSEFVFSKRLDSLSLGELKQNGFWSRSERWTTTASRFKGSSAWIF